MSEVRVDHAYRVLRETAVAIAPDISDSLLHKLYTIQSEHQFDKDREIAIEKMKALILTEIDGQGT